MDKTPQLRGLANISFYAADHEAAKQWYTQLLGMPPYFELPGYAEFRIGDYTHELGLIDSRYAPGGPSHGPGGAILYWHVDDVSAMLERLISLGAKPFEPEIVRGGGFITASVVDPFGNVLGIIYSPHYVEVLAAAHKPA